MYPLAANVSRLAGRVARPCARQTVRRVETKAPPRVRVIEENQEFVVPFEHYEDNRPGRDDPAPGGDDSATRRATLKDLSPETRHVLTYKGRKLPVQVVVGRKGVDEGLLGCLSLHFRRHDVVRVGIAKQWKDNVAEIAQELEDRSGGVVLERTGRRLILFRGLQYSGAPQRTPQNGGWWNQFPTEKQS